MLCGSKEAYERTTCEIYMIEYMLTLFLARFFPFFAMEGTDLGALKERIDFKQFCRYYHLMHHPLHTKPPPRTRSSKGAFIIWTTENDITIPQHFITRRRYRKGSTCYFTTRRRRHYHPPPPTHSNNCTTITTKTTTEYPY